MFHIFKGGGGDSSPLSMYFFLFSAPRNLSSTFLQAPNKESSTNDFDSKLFIVSNVMHK